MTEQELRAMVREAIERQVGRETSPPPAASFHAHVSHGVFPLSRGSDDDGACVIEPTVRCNDCGFCLSYGH